jgi:hypothetical protein
MRMLALLFFFSLAVHAETFKIGGNQIEFAARDGLFLRGCRDKCEAIRVIKSFSKIDLTLARKGMTLFGSIGSDVCKKVYKAKSLLGVAQNGDGRAFCYFNDKSMIEINSLSTYLVQKKIVTE